jgi:fructokinase
MILSVGEILADMIVDVTKSELTFQSFCGGAPFNVAVNAKQAGGKVGFVGRVGNDLMGRFLIEKAGKADLDYLDIQVDKDKNTTLAFVNLKDGERDFSFYRHDTADYQIEFEEIDFEKYENLGIIHVGSLMLSEEKGRAFATRIFAETKKRNWKISFDMNFRLDTYDSFEDAKRAYKPFVEQADIIKFSEDEVALYTDIEDTLTAVKSLAKPNQLFVVTLGKDGSMYYYNGAYKIVPSMAVKPVDTTGAGDAFFGTLLSRLDGVAWTEETIENAMQKANEKGAQTTQFYGAFQLKE